MDLENQKRVKEFAEEYGAENLVVVLGAAEGEAAGLAAETVTLGDPTFAGPLTGVQLGLTVYHVCEPEMKAEFDEAVYDEQVGMMEMVLDVDDIVSEMRYSPKFLIRIKRTGPLCSYRGLSFFQNYNAFVRSCRWQVL